MAREPWWPSDEDLAAFRRAAEAFGEFRRSPTAFKITADMAALRRMLQESGQLAWIADSAASTSALLRALGTPPKLPDEQLAAIVKWSESARAELSRPAGAAAFLRALAAEPRQTPRLDPEEAAEISAAADQLAEQEPSTETASIRDAVRALPPEERGAVLERLGSVIVAVAGYVNKLIEEDSAGSLAVALIGVLYSLLILYAAVQRAITALETATDDKRGE